MFRDISQSVSQEWTPIILTRGWWLTQHVTTRVLLSFTWCSSSLVIENSGREISNQRLLGDHRIRPKAEKARRLFHLALVMSGPAPLSWVEYILSKRFSEHLSDAQSEPSTGYIEMKKLEPVSCSPSSRGAGWPPLLYILVGRGLHSSHWHGPIPPGQGT